jgi:flagellar basal-body rod protein FlgB
MNATPSKIDMLVRLLDVADMRHRVISENVANVNTPGYHAMTVTFEDAFQKALKRKDARLLEVQPRIVEGDEPLQTRIDGNTVDIDVEMARLAKNTILYRTLIQVLTSEIGSMRTAIAGR